MFKPEQVTLLFVDDEVNVLSALQRVFRKSGYNIITAQSASEALKLMEHKPVNLVLSDARMPGMDGSELLTQVAERWPFTIRLLLTGYTDMDATIDAINHGKIFQYLSKPWNDHDLRSAVTRGLEKQFAETEIRRLTRLTKQQNQKLKAANAELESRVSLRTAELQQIADMLDRSYEELQDGYARTVEAFASFLDLRQNYLKGHGKRVAVQCRNIAQRLKLPASEIREIYFAALLHDIGMTVLDDTRMSKARDTMSAEELKEYRKHVIIGESVMMAINPLQNSARLIRHHHERYDGKGFPDQLKGEAIPLGSRIITLCDEYEALIHGHISYYTLNEEEAINYLQQYAGIYYDPKLVELFIQLHSENKLSEGLNLVHYDPRALQPGMILGADIVAKQGIVLVSSGRKLDNYLIGKLINYEKEHQERLKIFIRKELPKTQT